MASGISNNNNKGGNPAADSNQSLWQQYLVAFNKFKENQKSSTYSSQAPSGGFKETAASENVEATVGTSWGNGETQPKPVTSFPAGDRGTITSPPANHRETINLRDDDDIVINFDNNETISAPDEERFVSPKKEVSAYMNGSGVHPITSSVASRPSVINEKFNEPLESIPASFSGEFEHQQLVPAPLFDSTHSGSDASDEVTYHPGRFNMARKLKKQDKGKSLALTRKSSNKVQKIVQPNYPVASPDVKEELKGLQQKMITQTGNRVRGIPEEGTIVINEFLELARQGEGTDPNSEIYKHLRKSVTDIPTTKLIGYGAMNAGYTQASTAIRNPKLDTYMKRLQGPWAHYHEDIPFNEDEPDPDSIPVWGYNQQAKTSDGFYLTKAAALDENGQPANWENSFGSENPEWLRGDMMDNHNPQYLLVFRHWLETAVGLPEPVITNRRSFYDGTAHPDGIHTMFIPEFDEVIAFLDFSDTENTDHSHETSFGYIQNTMARQRQEAIAAEASQRAAQLDYRSMLILRPEQNPNVPRANVYLRPVENRDINELTALYNWYVVNTVRTLESMQISEQEMMDRKNECRRESLPFIVAIERRLDTRNIFTEAVVGFASATDFTGSDTASRYTAQLELFVHHERLGLGIANCLIDKLLSVCDRTFVMKQGYFFDSSPAGRAAYSAGGNRELARLIFIIHFVNSDDAEYLWLKDWLESRFMFEEQALLKGAAYKHNRVVNSSYLVRNTGKSLRDIRINEHFLE